MLIIRLRLNDILNVSHTHNILELDHQKTKSAHAVCNLKQGSHNQFVGSLAVAVLDLIAKHREDPSVFAVGQHRQQSCYSILR